MSEAPAPYICFICDTNQTCRWRWLSIDRISQRVCTRCKRHVEKTGSIPKGTALEKLKTSNKKAKEDDWSCFHCGVVNTPAWRRLKKSDGSFERLCDFCNRYHARNGVLPSIELLEKKKEVDELECFLCHTKNASSLVVSGVERLVCEFCRRFYSDHGHLPQDEILMKRMKTSIPEVVEGTSLPTNEIDWSTMMDMDNDPISPMILSDSIMNDEISGLSIPFEVPPRATPTPPPTKRQRKQNYSDSKRNSVDLESFVEKVESRVQSKIASMESRLKAELRIFMNKLESSFSFSPGSSSSRSSN